MKQLRNELIRNTLVSIVSLISCLITYHFQKLLLFAICTIIFTGYIAMCNIKYSQFQLFYLTPYSKRKIVAVLRLPMLLISFGLCLWMDVRYFGLFLFITMIGWLTYTQHSLVMIGLQFYYILRLIWLTDQTSLEMWVVAVICAIVIIIKYLYDTFEMKQDLV